MSASLSVHMYVCVCGGVVCVCGGGMGGVCVYAPAFNLSICMTERLTN